MIDTKELPYYIDTTDLDNDYYGKVLKGPNGIEFCLGEPEDCNWFRDGREIMDKLNWYEEQLRDTTPLTREELEGVINGACGCLVVISDRLYSQQYGFDLPLSAVTRATLRSCGVIR